MKAVRMHESGGVENLVYEDAPDPVIAGNEVLVRVKACALNHLEVWATSMPAGAKYPKPRITGSDIAGVVEAVGDTVSGVEVGAEVMLQPGVSCGICEACLAGLDNQCRSYTVLGAIVAGSVWDGGFAELVKAPPANIVPKPENLSFEEAASIPLVFVTAWHMLVARANLQRNETVLVNAAGSGVGIAATQIGKLLGARVIASAGSDAKLQKAAALGADEGINYTTSDLAQEVLRLTDGRGVDVVFEHIGGDIFQKSVQALGRSGRLVTCGATAGPMASFAIMPFLARQQAFLGSFMGAKSELLKMMPYFRSRQLRPVVDRAYPLSEAQAAVRQLASRDVFGKIVVVP
jgi:NADPH:quinone reductase-like Zn-dependent oxidoreductase